VIPIFLPALRERREDIALLTEKLIENANRSSRRKIERISPSALAVLERHDWPGNVRELRNVLAYAYAIGDGPILGPSDLPPELFDSSLGGQAEVNTPSNVGRDLAPEARRLLQVLE